MLDLYDLLKESKDTMHDHRNVVTDGKQFGASIA